jgi:hypothetical protein
MMFTRQTVGQAKEVDLSHHWGFGWLMSVGLHIVALLGLTLIGVDSLISSAGSDPSILIGFRHRPWITDRMNNHAAIIGTDPLNNGDPDLQINPWVVREDLPSGRFVCGGDDPAKGSDDDSPVALLADELARIFPRGEPSPGCVFCATERGIGLLVAPRDIQPAGLCCRHVLLLEKRCRLFSDED